MPKFDVIITDRKTGKSCVHDTLTSRALANESAYIANTSIDPQRYTVQVIAQLPTAKRKKNPCPCRAKNPAPRPKVSELAHDLIAEYHKNGEPAACKLFDKLSRLHDLMKRDEATLKRAFNELLESATTPRRTNPVPVSDWTKLNNKIKKRIETLSRSNPDVDYIGGWVGGELKLYLKNNQHAFFGYQINDNEDRVKIKCLFAFPELDGKVFDIDEFLSVNKKRRTNPVPPSKIVQVHNAADLYTRFTGHEALEEVTIDKPTLPDVMLVVGDIDGVMYTTVRDGVTEKYVHQFKKSARPLFCVSHDGKQIHLIGGEYDFTERGIVDRT